MRFAVVMSTAIALTTWGCRQPPVKGQQPDGTDPRKLEHRDLETDVELIYVVSWDPGRSVRIELSRKAGEIEGQAVSTWHKSSLMPGMSWTLGPDEATLAHLLGLAVDADLIAAGADPPGDPECMLRVETSTTTFSRKGECAEIRDDSFERVTGALHPWWFSASHLLAAGVDAEPQIAAKNVYGYYTDGIEILGPRYGPLGGDITIDQLELAEQKYAREEWVDAVIAVRNALSSRVNFYRKTKMTALSPSQLDPPLASD